MVQGKGTKNYWFPLFHGMMDKKNSLSLQEAGSQAAKMGYHLKTYLAENDWTKDLDESVRNRMRNFMMYHTFVGALTPRLRAMSFEVGIKPEEALDKHVYAVWEKLTSRDVWAVRGVFVPPT